MAKSHRNGLGDAVVEQQAIGKAGDHIVVRGMCHLKRHGPRRAHIVENNHRAYYAARPVVDGRGGIFNRGFIPVATDEHAVDCESDRRVLFDGHLHGISCSLARAAINNSKDFGERFARGFCTEPSRHLFCNDIQIGDIAEDVSTQNGVTNRVERNHGALFFYEQRVLNAFAFDRIPQRALERIGIQMRRHQIILRATAYRLLRQCFGPVSSEDKYGNIR